MPYALYDYVNVDEENEFRKWTESLQTVQRAKLNQKLDMLEMHGDSLYPLILTGTPISGIQKLRIKGNVHLRPLLCKGPIYSDEEYTLLKGALEVGSKFQPKNAPTIANNNKNEVVNDHEKRRTKHERVS